LSEENQRLVAPAADRPSVIWRKDMGEWSEYFEDFPEENPGNYVDGKFDPGAASAQRERQQKAASQLKDDQKRLDDEIAAIVEKHKKPN
jgi:hypothetical protein